MLITFRRVSNEEHAVEVMRRNGTGDVVVLSTKDFLRHDLAHLAVETELGLRDGVWGSVARGGRLGGEGLDGSDVALAERMAGRLQTLMRLGAGVPAYVELLDATVPDQATPERASRLHEHVRRLVGHWNATGFGDVMTVEWPDE